MKVKNNLLFRMLSSLFVIFIALYFVPFLGICLILLRYFILGNKRRMLTPLWIIGFGIIIFIPKGLKLVLDTVNFDLTRVPYLSDLVNTELYNLNLINYSKNLIYIGVILLIISFVLKTILNKLSIGIRDYMIDIQKRDMEISKKNDMEIKMKQERAKNTSYVKCPYCGSDNILGEKIGTCEYCRRKIENKNFKVNSDNNELK